VADGYDSNDKVGIHDPVDDPIVADADSIEIPVRLQLGTPWGRGFSLSRAIFSTSRRCPASGILVRSRNAAGLKTTP